MRNNLQSKFYLSMSEQITARQFHPEREWGLSKHRGDTA